MVGVGHGGFLPDAGLHLDGDLKGGHIVVNAAVLHFLALIVDPATLPWDAVAGVVEDDNELPTFFDPLAHIGKNFLRILHVLESEYDGAMGKAAIYFEGLCRICDHELVKSLLRALLSLLNQVRRAINPEVGNTLGHLAAQDSLATT